MSVSWASSSRRCLVCGTPSLLTVHRRCDRKMSARARGLHSALAGRGQQPGPSAEVAAVPASFSRVLPVGGTRKVGQGVSSSQAAAVATPRPLAVDRSEVT